MILKFITAAVKDMKMIVSETLTELSRSDLQKEVYGLGNTYQKACNELLEENHKLNQALRVFLESFRFSVEEGDFQVDECGNVILTETIYNWLTIDNPQGLKGIELISKNMGAIDASRHREPNCPEALLPDFYEEGYNGFQEYKKSLIEGFPEDFWSGVNDFAG